MKLCCFSSGFLVTKIWSCSLRMKFLYFFPRQAISVIMNEANRRLFLQSRRWDDDTAWSISILTWLLGVSNTFMNYNAQVERGVVPQSFQHMHSYNVLQLHPDVTFRREVQASIKYLSTPPLQASLSGIGGTLAKRWFCCCLLVSAIDNSDE